MKEGRCCRLLVGMQRLPEDELRAGFGVVRGAEEEIDNQTALRLKKKLAESFRDQLAIGMPANEDVDVGAGELIRQHQHVLVPKGVDVAAA